MTAQLGQAQDPTPIEPADPAHPPDGMRVTPEVTLFVGGGILSIALIVVMVWFWMKITRQERAAERQRGGGGV